jgi:hypothetical protein
MATRKIVSKHIAQSASSYVGRKGELILDTVTNELKISDGSTSGGTILNTDGSSGGGGSGISNIVEDTSPQLGGNLDNNNFNILVADSSNNGTNNSLQLGTGGDLKMYHDGSHTYFKNNTGNFKIHADQIDLQAANGQNMIECDSAAAPSGGRVILYHNNNAKLETTSTGVTVTGKLTASSISETNIEKIHINDNIISTYESNANLELSANGTGSVIIQSIEINGNRISATDSTRIKFNDAIEVSGIDFTDEGHGISGSGDPNQMFYSSGGGTGVHIFQGDVERMAGANLTTISDPDGSGTAAMIDTANGRNLVIHAGNGGDFNYSTLYLRGTKIELGEGLGAISIQENNITTTRSNDNLVLDANGTGGIEILTQVVRIANLPTSDPTSAGQLWNDSGALKISAG